ncbi:MAG TPA: hypothetical protein VKU19_25415 [Bryobacteraceae bacterium]|nr:hypothetical protein [Bryobacteraceae bacterium]
MKGLKIGLLVLVLFYAGDYLSLRLRIPNREPLSNVEIKVFYAVKLKGSKTGFEPADTETVTCANSLLPQEGYKPCWYVSRHTQKWVDVGD